MPSFYQLTFFIALFIISISFSLTTDNQVTPHSLTTATDSATFLAGILEARVAASSTVAARNDTDITDGDLEDELAELCGLATNSSSITQEVVDEINILAPFIFNSTDDTEVSFNCPGG